MCPWHDLIAGLMFSRLELGTAHSSISPLCFAFQPSEAAVCRCSPFSCSSLSIAWLELAQAQLQLQIVTAFDFNFGPPCAHAMALFGTANAKEFRSSYLRFEQCIHLNDGIALRAAASDSDDIWFYFWTAMFS